MTILKSKKCKYHHCIHNSTSVHGSNIFCRQHTISQCALKSQLNVYNDMRCNSVVPMITFRGKLYCNSHYRTLIMNCNHKKCIKTRDTSELGFDKYWYCKKHQLTEQELLVKLAVIFKNKLPFEIIQKICKYHFKNKIFI